MPCDILTQTTRFSEPCKLHELIQDTTILVRSTHDAVEAVTTFLVRPRTRSKAARFWLLTLERVRNTFFLIWTRSWVRRRKPRFLWFSNETAFSLIWTLGFKRCRLQLCWVALRAKHSSQHSCRRRRSKALIIKENAVSYGNQRKRPTFVWF